MARFSLSPGLLACSIAFLSWQPTATAQELVGPEEADRSRIRAHLFATEAQLRGTEVASLPEGPRRARAALLDELHRYAQRGEFPRNTHAAGERVPVFIDDDGRSCAVAALMLATGHNGLVERLRREHEFDRIADMPLDLLSSWGSAHGLTVEECSQIQPLYCFCPEDAFPVCGEDGKSYLNSCVALLCAQTKVASCGVCPKEPTFSATVEPNGELSRAAWCETCADPAVDCQEQLTCGFCDNLPPKNTGGAAGSGGAGRGGEGGGSGGERASGEPEGEGGCAVNPRGEAASGVLALFLLCAIRRRR